MYVWCRPLPPPGVGEDRVQRTKRWKVRQQENARLLPRSESSGKKQQSRILTLPRVRFALPPLTNSCNREIEVRRRPVAKRSSPANCGGSERCFAGVLPSENCYGSEKERATVRPGDSSAPFPGRGSPEGSPGCPWCTVGAWLILGSARRAPRRGDM